MVTAVIWHKYYKYGVKPNPINQLNAKKKILSMCRTSILLFKLSPKSWMLRLLAPANNVFKNIWMFPCCRPIKIFYCPREMQPQPSLTEPVLSVKSWRVSGLLHFVPGKNTIPLKCFKTSNHFFISSLKHLASLMWRKGLKDLNMRL